MKQPTGKFEQTSYQDAADVEELDRGGDDRPPSQDIVSPRRQLSPDGGVHAAGRPDRQRTPPAQRGGPMLARAVVAAGLLQQLAGDLRQWHPGLLGERVTAPFEPL